MSRAVYHSRRREQAATPVHGPAAVIALVLLFPDNSKSVALIRHSINVDEKVVTVVDPGEIPVFACDQPLFKIAQKNQWMWPKKYGEESFVIILRGLHIKMAVLKALGHLLDGSDLASALIQAEIATALIFFLKVVHVQKPLLHIRLQLAVPIVQKLLRKQEPTD